MKRALKQFCVIGLGHFGAALARTLAQKGEVLALDCDMERVNSLSGDVQHALCLDARDFQALSSVVSRDFDEAIVSIGGNLESSILCTLHLKRIGIPVIRAKATSADHATILESVGAAQIIFPEKEAAERLALRILNPNLLDYVSLGQDYRVMEVIPSTSFQGHTLAELDLRNHFGVFAIAIRRGADKSVVFLPSANERVEAGDLFTLIGKERDILSLRHASLPERPPAPAPAALPATHQATPPTPPHGLPGATS